MTNEQVNKLVNDNGKMAYLLGLCFGALGELLSNDKLAMCQKEPLMNIYNALNRGCGTIFYGKENE